jgi:aspartate/methionine/tyrosine aminotransferase
MVRLSDASNRLRGQEMFQILAKANELEKYGKHVLHFELGDPDFDTPKNIIKACYESLRSGETHYTNSAGIKELKIAAVNSTQKGRRGFKPNEDQLLVTPGANIQIYYAMACTINPGEDVIIPDPSFVSYSSIADFLGINSVKVPLYEKNKFRLNPDDVEKAITDKTRMIIINSPSNPTGAVMKEEEIRKIYDIADKKDIWLLSDEIYTRMIYEDEETKFFSPSMIDQCKKRTIVVNGFSKAYAMTGWRIGIVTAPSDLINRMGLLLETTSSCMPPFIQKAGVEALEGNQEPVHKMITEYKKRRDVMVQGLNNLPGVSCINPSGAFYVFPNITKTGKTSKEFADFILEEAGVALSPGSIFGKYGEGYVRLCYCNSLENIENGIDRMGYALRGGELSF